MSGFHRSNQDQKRHVLLVSPYHGGSHEAWADGLRASSYHDIEMLTMPDRFWKWRMHGGALTIARDYQRLKYKPDCILATDMLDLTTFLALTRRATADIPTVLYMHENQLTYPLPDDPDQGPMRRQRGERDYHYAFINVASMFAADTVLFNSEYHRKELFEALPRFLKHFPDFNEIKALPALLEKSSVIPVGVDLNSLTVDSEEIDFNEPPLIIWNHRWEYDKDPGRFFDALYRLQSMEIPFRLALCGRNYRRQPSEFAEAQERLASNIIHSGYADKETYRRLLWEASIMVSTARHEFFGVSTIEAVYCQTFPVLPMALSYPELIPAEFHLDCLYQSQDELVTTLLRAISDRLATREKVADLSQAVSKFDWTHVAHLYDGVIDALCDKIDQSQ